MVLAIAHLLQELTCLLVAVCIATRAAARGRGFLEGPRIYILRVVPITFCIQTGAYLRATGLLVKWLLEWYVI